MAISKGALPNYFWKINVIVTLTLPLPLPLNISGIVDNHHNICSWYLHNNMQSMEASAK